MKLPRFSIARALVIVGTLSLAACSPIATPAPSASTPSASTPAASTPAVPALSGNLTIFAAASLAASFTELAKDFTADHPGVTINPISFDGSSTLATQINEGAPVDVFASADEVNMTKVSSFINGASTLFASNVLQIAVQPGNPLGIKGLSDLAKPGVQVVLCAPAVPCGAASHKILDLDGVAFTPVSEEQNVKSVLTKVSLGEADAGLVYVTDVTAAAGAVEGVTIAGADRAVNAYPIATLAASKNVRAATAFVAFILSAKGQSILAKYGFSAP